MNEFILGLSMTFVIIIFLEIFRKIDRKFIASLTCAVIPFIYIGFSIGIDTLILTIPGASFFLYLAYLGFKKHYFYSVAGLALHGLWDFVFPHINSNAPEGYDIFCITIDILLAIYFYIRLKNRQE